MIIGAAVLGTAAATAQASVLPFGPSAPAAATTHAATGGGTKTASLTKSGRGAARGKPGRGAPPSTSRKKARPTAEQAIGLARSQVGIAEDRGGGTKFQRWYMGTSRAGETVGRDGGSIGLYGDANWCDMFVSWVGDRLGFSYSMGWDAWTVAHARWFQDQDRWGTRPRPGAVVFYDWRGGGAVSGIDHVGMVIRTNRDGTIQTVEGNTGDAVRVKTRATDKVVGYGYPAYAS
ncbi:CHAP domain-containing protein [Actinomadura graeca]|uniref:CHAP domain-containing protein n=2 Tax=Actinomadura graeca TaxID=2750812 RepID=A0ABX8RD52_9ACTN|nr:CHAP domain-containing protein [Actinomadura graeca]